MINKIENLKKLGAKVKNNKQIDIKYLEE